MSDIPKSVRQVAGFRRALLVVALSLTVVAFMLGWYEVVTAGSPAPRAFVWGIAIVTWIAWIAVNCAVLIVLGISKRIDRAVRQIVEAICEKHMANLADLLEDGSSNVRSINERGERWPGGR